MTAIHFTQYNVIWKGNLLQAYSTSPTPELLILGFSDDLFLGFFSCPGQLNR